MQQHLQHPTGLFQGMQPENVFFLIDELGVQNGMGYVVYQYQMHLDPDCPINIYFHMEPIGDASYQLLGALVARARQMRDQALDVKARIYTNVAPGDENTLAFFAHNGLSAEDSERVMLLHMPVGESRVPMSCSMDQVPLNTIEEQMALLGRLQQNDIAHLSLMDLQRMMRTPHFHCLGLFRAGQLIGEAIVSGTGSQCELQAVYIRPGYRRQGFAKALIHRLMAIKSSEGVQQVLAHFLSRSGPQRGLARAFQAEEMAVVTLFPKLEI
ncbi:MAG: GNAT family N-acetyltransferase [Clostridia bacterium]|nr:GNAT family N-acetyltransferase [Clostridia bacterium]